MQGWWTEDSGWLWTFQWWHKNLWWNNWQQERLKYVYEYENDIIHTYIQTTIMIKHECSDGHFQYHLSRITYHMNMKAIRIRINLIWCWMLLHINKWKTKDLVFKTRTHSKTDIHHYWRGTREISNIFTIRWNHTYMWVQEEWHCQKAIYTQHQY